MNQDAKNKLLLTELFLEEIYNHVDGMLEDWDKPWWMLHSTGNFLVNSA